MMLVDLGQLQSVVLCSSFTPGFRSLLHLFFWIVPFCARSPVQCHFFAVTLSLCTSCHLCNFFLWTLLIFLLQQCFWFLSCLFFSYFREMFFPLSSAAHCLLDLHMGHPSVNNNTSGKQYYSKTRYEDETRELITGSDILYF